MLELFLHFIIVWLLITFMLSLIQATARVDQDKALWILGFIFTVLVLLVIYFSLITIRLTI